MSAANELSAWLRRRAALADRVFAVEEALLSGRFAVYAARRLTAFGLARALAVALHVVELTILAEIFAARAFVASLALLNAVLVVDALWWGSLESLRRTLRELGPSTEAAARLARWMRGAVLVGLFVVLVPIARSLGRWRLGIAPTLLEAYAFACAVRLAADVVLRTYYSGVYAYRRVHRPVWSVFVGPIVLVGSTLALWGTLAGYAFPVATLLAAASSRGLLLSFTRRAYERHRIPQPRLHLFRGPKPAASKTMETPPAPREARSRAPRLAPYLEASLAGLANLATRLGSVVLLAAAIPSLADAEAGGPVFYGFAFAMHLAAPFLFTSSQWAFVFYHDYKRLEEDDAAALRRQLGVRLFGVSILVGVVAWGGAVMLIGHYVPLVEAWPALTSLFVSTLGLSVWSALQVQGFARGEFVRQLASAAAILGITWATVSSSGIDDETWLLALAVAPWIALAVAAILARVERSPRRGEIESLAKFVRAASSVRGEIVVWSAELAFKSPLVASRILDQLGSRGALVRVGRRVLWFERPPFSSKIDWLACAAGALSTLERVGPLRGRAVRERLERDLDVRGPDGPSLAELVSAHARLFPDGFVLELGKRPPASFAALPAAHRQLLWRDALRVRRGGRRRGPFLVSAYAPNGVIEAIFVRPRVSSERVTPASAGMQADEDQRAWRALHAATDFRWDAGDSAAGVVDAGPPGRQETIRRTG